jgi:hypothetical protein
MSKRSADDLPLLPETHIHEPIVQCGVLYLGTAVPSSGQRGLDSVQEPLSHRYPIDGTNQVHGNNNQDKRTTRRISFYLIVSLFVGIDAILSIYDNGIQLAFVRQEHTVIFYPLSSLIYCSSLRFAIVENPTTSTVDWRFMTLDSLASAEPSKHPPLFCIVVQRTQVVAADECHCFITKTEQAALTLVRVIAKIYGDLSTNHSPRKSPIFYQV